MAGRRRGEGACGACGAPCVVDSSAFISFSSAEISGSDDPSAATSGCGVSSLILVAVSRPAHARERESSRAVRCCWPGHDPRARMRACGAGHATIECRRSPGRARLRSRYTNCGGGNERTLLSPLDSSMLAICPENDSPFYGFIRSGLNYEHHVRITYTSSGRRRPTTREGEALPADDHEDLRHESPV